MDQVVGARTSEQGTHKLLRVPAKWLIRKLAERLTNTQIPDLNSGSGRSGARSRGLTCGCCRPASPRHHDHRRVPVQPARGAVRADRVRQAVWISKFKFVEDAYRYILQVLRMVMYFNPLKVLMPVALFLLGLGILKGVYYMVVHPLLFAVNTVLIFVTGVLIASLALLADLIVRSRGDV